MTKSLDALRAEAQRDPHADAPRTVLADALEQQGEVDRAQLIHLQVQRAALPAWDPKLVALELKERAILARCEAAWRAELPQLAGVTWGSFTRGFVSKVAFDKPELVARHRDACLGATPIHGVAIRWPKGKTRPALEAIEGLTELTVVGTVMHHEDLKWLASCPILATVDALNLVDSNLRQGPFALLASPHLANVTAVRLPSNQLGDNGAAALLLLARWPSSPRSTCRSPATRRAITAAAASRRSCRSRARGRSRSWRAGRACRTCTRSISAAGSSGATGSRCCWRRRTPRG